MSKIQEYLEQIRLARYGKDVRQAIHDAIHQCYEDGKAGSVDLVARESIEALQEDINSKTEKMEIATTTSTTIQGTKHGGFRLTKMLANTIQNGVPSPATSFPLLSTGDCVEMIVGGHNTTSGAYSSTYTSYICNKYPIPCKSGDVIKFVVNDEHVNDMWIIYYDESMSRVTFGHIESNIAEFNAPSGVAYFNINIGNVTDINPQTVGKITITINGKYLGVAKTHGKNFLNPSRITHTFIGSGLVPSTNSEYDLYELFEVGEYVLSWGKNSTGYTYIIYYDENKNIILRDVYSATVGNSALVDTTKGSYFRVMHANSTASTFPVDVQLEKGTIATPFEEHKETVVYYLTQYPMIKGSTLYRENGLVKAKHGRAETIFKGSESWSYSADVGNGIYRFESTALINVVSTTDIFNVMSDKFTVGSDGAYKCRFNADGDLLMWVPGDVLSEVSASAFKTWLTSNPTTVQYPLATPTIETLDAESQIALNSLETFDGMTYVEFDTRVQPLEFEAEVGTSQVGAYTLESLNNSESNAVKIEDAINTMLLITP